MDKQLVDSIISQYGWQGDDAARDFVFSDPTIAQALLNGRPIITELFGADVEITLDYDEEGAVLWIYPDLSFEEAQARGDQLEERWSLEAYQTTKGRLTPGVI